MKYHVLFYCPDTHIQYDGHTPYRKGVGGGITARIRFARALHRAGHRVTMVVNCARKARIDGVQYIPLAEARDIKGDILVLNTSGGQLDLSPLLEMNVQVDLRFVWTSGTPRPGGLDDVGYDFVYAKSNFLRNVAHLEWGVPENKIFVAYNGFEEDTFRKAEKRKPARDPYRLVYFSHPSKGLNTAIAILKRLRAVDQRFTLHVFGGNQLWGQEEGILPQEDGVFYRGLVRQSELARELLQASYSLNLQARLEPFGMVIIEGMRAGQVVLASPVGAYRELVRDGEDGYLIAGDHLAEETHARAAGLILDLTSSPDVQKHIQRGAAGVIWDTNTMVQVWEGHWRWWFWKKGVRTIEDKNPKDECPVCDGERLWLADGYHCTGCGNYSRGRMDESAQ
jgi:glycosyltransferase involved in cell wall biosynthesis